MGIDHMTISRELVDDYYTFPTDNIRCTNHLKVTHIAYKHWNIRRSINRSQVYEDISGTLTVAKPKHTKFSEELADSFVDLPLFDIETAHRLLYDVAILAWTDYGDCYECNFLARAVKDKRYEVS